MASKESNLIKPPNFKSPEHWLRAKRELGLESVTPEAPSDIDKELLKRANGLIDRLVDRVYSLPSGRITSTLSFLEPEFFMIYKALGREAEAHASLASVEKERSSTPDLIFRLKASVVDGDISSATNNLAHIKGNFSDDFNRSLAPKFLPYVSSYLHPAFYAWLLGDDVFAKEVYDRAVRENKGREYKIYEKLLECVLDTNNLIRPNLIIGLLEQTYGIGKDGLFVEERNRHAENVIQVNVTMALIMVILAGVDPKRLLLLKK
jgi:hypothetical protein